ncbi:F0F1 ATP synthase subunit delta [Periweissella cryptocerci]|uniref:ATP synthase subunit delta n=1 Tax=Periweissella cryptocerci TaxID=2506420 RepID=A0A4P6YV85_9LACO|nr:ATP synthase F1 subunit delta [Periweissella cryptocerci]QBO36729.1 F0F1 ATP synthase subunit delta [Periweissella cryptocerci]
MKLDQTTIAKRYSKALFELAEEAGSTDAVFEELTSLKAVFVDNAELGSQLNGPALPTSAKKTIIEALKQDATPVVANFIQMSYDYGRTDDVVAIVDAFQRLVDEKKSVVYASVTTAVDLAADQKERLATEFAKRVGANKVVLDTKVDPAIVGGVIVQSDSQILDGSVATKLAKVRRMLVK